VGGFASDVRSVGQQLREQGKDQPAKLADQAADRAERLGNYLTGSDADRILGDVEDFGRRQPWAIIAGGVALGFAASRFLKASSSRRYESRWDSPYATDRGAYYGGTDAGLPATTPPAPGVPATGTGRPATTPSAPDVPATGGYDAPGAY